MSDEARGAAPLTPDTPAAIRCPHCEQELGGDVATAIVGVVLDLARAFEKQNRGQIVSAPDTPEPDARQLAKWLRERRELVLALADTRLHPPDADSEAAYLDAAADEIERLRSEVAALVVRAEQAENRVEQLRAVARLVYPDDMTPAAKRQFDSVYESWELS